MIPEQLHYFSASHSVAFPLCFAVGAALVVAGLILYRKYAEYLYSAILFSVAGTCLLAAVTGCYVDGSKDAMLSSILAGEFEIVPFRQNNSGPYGIALKPIGQKATLRALGKTVDVPFDGKMLFTLDDIKSLDQYIRKNRPDLVASWADNTSKLALMPSN
jgi:hypothetical protein